ncbi:MAG: 50S ribosomal protein L6 [Candidatus Omnitrophica bacterium]|nr:50S ribosomal protein L6 [Candidatus Omnitrophota bacterium]MDD5352216.1 50S ribosomal protein L6 [Candidatus Omnitrophota bacterium]MDD5549814.1 50S ribosomal protein L6 [Candidatus Omnitrophota bacterium]
MSRIGKKPIIVPAQVKINISGKKVHIEGKNGKLEYILPDCVSVELRENALSFKGASDSKQDKTLWGTSRALIANMIKGVDTGYEKQLEIVGVGFRAQSQQNKLDLKLGFTHPVAYVPPEGVKVETPKPNQIFVKGIDKIKVGQAAAEIRAIMPPEPYKGKGIRYLGEYVRKKSGKAVTTKQQA